MRYFLYFFCFVFLLGCENQSGFLIPPMSSEHFSTANTGNAAPCVGINCWTNSQGQLDFQSEAFLRDWCYARNGVFSPARDAVPARDGRPALKGTEAKCFSFANSSADADQMAKRARNEIVFVGLRISDRICEDHLAAMQKIGTGTNVITGTLVSVFAGLASVATSTAAQTNLAAGAAFFNSERSLINEEVYLNTYTAVITGAIRSERRTLLTKLEGRLIEGVSSYPVSQALTDIERYHYQCSASRGMEIVAAKMNDQSRADENNPEVVLARLEARIQSLTDRMNCKSTEQSCTTLKAYLTAEIAKLIILQDNARNEVFAVD